MTKPNTIEDCRSPNGRLDPRRVRRLMRKIRGKRTKAEFVDAQRQSVATYMARVYEDAFTRHLIGGPVELP